MVEIVAWRTLGLELTKCQTNGCEVGSPRSNQLGTLRRDGKQFVERRRRKKREKERKKKERKEKGRRKLLHPLFQIWVDQELILHTSRGEGSFLFGYFLVWGHGNGIWLSLLCDCLKE